MPRLASFALASALALVAIAIPSEASAKHAAIPDPLKIDVENALPAYYYKPYGKGLKPVLMYLHGRGGNPAEDCRKWAKVGRQFGWVVCPQGPGETESGGRTWSTGPADARRIIDATLQALRDKYHRRVQLRGNVLIGFSEGAFIAMNVGVAEQRVWNRWLVLGASDAYWGGGSPESLDPDKHKVKRVYLLTGENDGVAQNSVRVGKSL
jgi:predicted esterase